MSEEGTTEVKSRTIPELSVDTQILERKLQSAEPGEILPYEVLTASIRRCVRTEAYSNLQSARRRLERAGCHFETVRGVGVKRIPNEDVPATTKAFAMTKIRRISRRSARRLLSVDYNRLSEGAKVIHNTALSVFGAVSAVTQPKTLKRVAERVREQHQKLPVAETLALFAKKE